MRRRRSRRLDQCLTIHLRLSFVTAGGGATTLASAEM
jgi:hypothetical protein